MGDRGNIYLKNSNIYLYTHWCGSALPLIVQQALVRGKDRWTDEPYLNRIIFCELLSPETLSSNTGFGISNYICDNENPIIEIDVGMQQVAIDGKTWTFEDYCKIHYKEEENDD